MSTMVLPIATACAAPNSTANTQNTNTGKSVSSNTTTVKPKRTRAKKVLTEEQQRERKLKRKAQLQMAQQIYRNKKLRKSNELVDENATLKQIVKDLHNILKMRANVDYLQDFKHALDENKRSLIKNIVAASDDDSDERQIKAEDNDLQIAMIPSNRDAVSAAPSSFLSDIVANHSEIATSKNTVGCQSIGAQAISSSLDDINLENILLMNSNHYNQNTDNKKFNFDLSFFGNIDCSSDISSDHSSGSGYSSANVFGDNKLLSNDLSIVNANLININVIDQGNTIISNGNNIDKDFSISMSLLSSLNHNDNYVDDRMENVKSCTDYSPFSTSSYEESQALFSPQQCLGHASPQRDGYQPSPTFSHFNEESVEQHYEEIYEASAGRIRQQPKRKHPTSPFGSYPHYWLGSGNVPDRISTRRYSDSRTIHSDAQLGIIDRNITRNDGNTHNVHIINDAGYHSNTVPVAGHTADSGSMKYIDLTNSNENNHGNDSITCGDTSLLLKKSKQNFVKLKKSSYFQGVGIKHLNHSLFTIREIKNRERVETGISSAMIFS